MSKVYTLGSNNPDAALKLQQWMSNPRTLLIDIRYAPNSRFGQWRMSFLQNLYGERYLWEGGLLGNINYDNDDPIVIADPEAGIRRLMHLAEDFDLVLLCGCRKYSICHRKVVIDLLRDAMPDIQIEVETGPGKLLKCFSTKPPYSDWLVHPEWFIDAHLQPKSIENRTWQVKHRGPIAIHASSTMDKKALDAWITKVPALKGAVPVNKEAYTLGAIVGLANLVDIVTESKNPWFLYGQYGWVLEGARAIEPVPWKGRQGLFEIPASLLGEQGEGMTSLRKAVEA